MNTAIWIIQGVLSAAFLTAGLIKIIMPVEKLREFAGNWVDEFADHQVKGIGFLEILGAAGLLLPMLLDVLPVFTPIASIGLGLTMIAAAVLHISRKEAIPVFINVFLLLLASAVAVGRLVLLPVFTQV